MWSSFSRLNASELTMRIRYPFTAHTRASEVPVLPPVYSTTVSPGFSRPSASARAITASAIRSLTLPVGFSHSSLARMRAAFGGTTLRKRTSDVWPMASRTSMASLLLGQRRQQVEGSAGHHRRHRQALVARDEGD